MNYFLAKTEPLEYSISDLKRDVKTVWTGVKNPQAKGFLRSMKKGDIVFIYHTGKEKAIVGSSTVLVEGEEPTLGFKEEFKIPITLSSIKANKELSDLRLVRQSRLSVMDVPAKLLNFIYT